MTKLGSRTFAGALLAGAMALTALPAVAQDVTLRVHHFLGTPSPAHARLIQPWAERVMEQSDGRINVEIYPSMQLGGGPPALYDQARDGVVDVVWTLPGYTAGRFPMVEVFELPFMAGTAEATSQAVHEFYETHLQEEFADVHVLALHVHAPGKFHFRDTQFNSLSDLQGLRVRAPTRVTNTALERLGAIPVGMPVPEVPEALSRGVVDGAVIPWEVALPLRVHELVNYHTEIEAERGFYTSVFLFAMNRNTYDSLPADLQAVIDANSGMALAAEAGRIWDEVEIPGRAAAVEAGNTINTLSDQVVSEMRALTGSVHQDWISEMDSRGLDGQALLQEARDLVAKYSD